MKAKFTKGEWRILDVEEGKEYLRVRGAVLGGRYKIANVIDLNLHHNGQDWCKIECEESIANAYLIAAAPEMYEMLESLREDYGLLTQVGKDIDELLAKARGEL